MNEDNSIVVFSGTTWQSQMVKSLLETSGISAYIKDEIIGTLAPWYSGGGGAAVKVVILNKDLDKARPIIEKYEQNMRIN